METKDEFEIQYSCLSQTNLAFKRKKLHPSSSNNECWTKQTPCVQSRSGGLKYDRFSEHFDSINVEFSRNYKEFVS